MAVMFVGTRFQSFKSDGTVNASGTVQFFEIGTTTHKQTYSNSALTAANADPVLLNSAGAADIWYTGDADVTVYDSTGTIIDSFSNIHPTETSTANELNLISNGSFESGDSVTAPDGWIRSEPYTGGTSTQDTDSSHGAYSWKFISTGSGGGLLTSESFFNVTVGRTLLLSWMIKSSVADIRNVVEVLWYDDADAYISASTAYDDSTTNPTSWTLKSYTATPVATAVKAKIRISGAHSSDSTAGTVRFDGMIVSESAYLYSDNTFTGNNTFIPAQKFTNGIGADYINNAYFTATVSAKALTVTLVGNDGAAPSATNPVQIAFRSATLTTGTSTTRTATATAAVVAPSGATLGFAAAATGHIYVYELDNAGTMEPVITGTPMWDEGIVHSTTAIGTGSDSGNVLYSTTARTNVAIRYKGRFKIVTGAVAGEWDNAPTVLSPSQPMANIYTAMNAAGSTMPMFACRAWVNFNGTGTPAIRASGNVASLTDDGLGLYTITFITAMTDANYAVIGNVASATAYTMVSVVSQSTGSCQVKTEAAAAGPNDPTIVNVAIFR